MHRIIGLITAFAVTFFTLPSLTPSPDHISVETQTQTQVTTQELQESPDQSSNKTLSQDDQMTDLKTLIADLDQQVKQANDLTEAINLIISGLLALLSYLIGNKLSAWLQKLFNKKRYKV
jgi:hypothetical protein